MIQITVPSLDRRRTVLIMAALMTATFITAIDLTIVGAAMPTIVGQLGGLSLYSWAFTSYLLTSTVTLPLYGKLADLYGRLPVFHVGVAIFLAGSALCGVAQTMEQLILFRALQGIGAGAVQPLVITMVGDVFTVEQRARFTALFSAVWGLAGVAGPAVGGVITDLISWRFVFYINVPIGLLASGMLWRFFPENVERRKHQLDILGAALMTVAITALLLATTATQGANVNPATTGGLLIAAAVAFVAFLQTERHAVEPVLPLGIFAIRAISVAALSMFLVGGLMFATTTFVPLLVQGVFGSTAAGAGAMLIPLSVGWPVGSLVGGRMIMRSGFRPTLLLGVAAIVAGSVPFVLVDEWTALAWVAVFLTILGFGLGLSSLATIIAAQSSVDWSRRGVATSVVFFARSMGGGIGVAVLGALLAGDLSQRLGGINLGAAGGVRQASALLEPSVRAAVDPSTLNALRVALAASLHPVFLGIAALSVGALIVALWFPRIRADDLPDGQPGGTGGAAA